MDGARGIRGMVYKKTYRPSSQFETQYGNKSALSNDFRPKEPNPTRPLEKFSFFS
jgi:hypothetical protein